MSDPDDPVEPTSTNVGVAVHDDGDGDVRVIVLSDEAGEVWAKAAALRLAEGLKIAIAARSQKDWGRSA